MVKFAVDSSDGGQCNCPRCLIRRAIEEGKNPLAYLLGQDVVGLDDNVAPVGQSVQVGIKPAAQPIVVVPDLPEHRGSFRKYERESLLLSGLLLGFVAGVVSTCLVVLTIHAVVSLG